jgi:hypothetical protein
MPKKTSPKIIGGVLVSKTSFNVPSQLLRDFGSECKKNGESQTAVMTAAMRSYVTTASNSSDSIRIRDGTNLSVPLVLQPGKNTLVENGDNIPTSDSHYRGDEWEARYHKIIEIERTRDNWPEWIRERLCKLAEALRTNLIGFEIAIDALIEIVDAKHERGPLPNAAAPRADQGGIPEAVSQKTAEFDEYERQAQLHAKEHEGPMPINPPVPERTRSGGKRAPKSSGGRGRNHLGEKIG